MAKRKFKLRVRVPPYEYPRTAWRREIHRTVAGALSKAKVRYTRSDRFEVALRLYFDNHRLPLVDIDNRLKDVLDALQGQVGGAGKKHRTLRQIIQNDSQVFRAVVEKSLPPKQSQHGWGHLTITKYRGPRYH